MSPLDACQKAIEVLEGYASWRPKNPTIERALRILKKGVKQDTRVHAWCEKCLSYSLVAARDPLSARSASGP